jgi:small subunit ribosomal protein S27Ae
MEILIKSKMVKNTAKREKKNKPTSKKYKFYTIDGDTVKSGKVCPRCGPGIFLADAKNRLYCGRCHYTEFMGKADQTTGEQKKPEVKEEKSEKKDEKAEKK